MKERASTNKLMISFMFLYFGSSAANMHAIRMAHSVHLLTSKLYNATVPKAWDWIAVPKMPKGFVFFVSPHFNLLYIRPVCFYSLFTEVIGLLFFFFGCCYCFAFLLLSFKSQSNTINRIKTKVWKQHAKGTENLLA